MFASPQLKMSGTIAVLKQMAAVCLLFVSIPNSIFCQVYNGNATVTKKINANGVASNGLNGITSGVSGTPGVRGWFYFNITSIPQGSTITSATLNYPTASGTQNSSSQANQLNALSFDPQNLSGTALYNALVNGANNVTNLFVGRWSGTHPLALNTNGPDGGNVPTATNLKNFIQARVNVGFTYLAFSLVRGSNNQYNFQTPSLTVNYVPPPPCTNPPVAGNTVINPSNACPSTLRTLSLNGATFGAGQIYQWQSSPNNSTWTNISGATVAQYQTNITTNSFYRCVVTCGSSSTSTSAQATVNNYLTCYCTTSYPNGCSSGDEIKNVTITGTTLNNNSSCSPGAYNFYSSPVHNLTKTVSYTLEVTVGGDALGQHAAAWIDFDQSGSFEVSELVGNQTTSVGANGTAVFNFTVPSTAVNGQTRLRVRGGDDVPLNDDESCGNTSSAWGETEDYLINILTPLPCNDPPVAGIINGPDSVCTTTNYQLNATGFSTGTTLQWQSSANSGGPFTDIPGETSAILSVTNAATDFYYVLKVTCIDSAFTVVKPVTIKQSVNCLCPATYNNDCALDNEITNVALGVLNNSSACSANGYAFYNNLAVPDLAKSVSYSLSVTMASDPNQYAGAWIDFNRNSIFESTEFVGGNSIDAGSNGTITITFAPPVTAIEGVTVLRIRGGHNIAVTSSEGCGLAFSNYGETEDYLVNILPQPPCIDPPVAGSINGNLSVCNGETTTLTLSGNSSNTTIQWQESSDGINYFDIPGEISASLTTGIITANTYYQAVVTCVNAVTTIPVQVIVKSFLECYCINNLNNTVCGNGHITTVSIATTTLNNVTGCSQQPPSGAYSNFPASGSTTATLQKNVYYNLSLQTNGTLGANTSVWIDFNQNGIFENTEWTQVYTNKTSGTIPVYIPSSALNGQTGMRVRSVLTGETISGFDACTNYSSGETEDYIVTIDNAPVCTDPPVAGTITGNLLVCAGSNVSLNATGYTLGTSLQWQSSTDNVNWSDISGANFPFLNSVQITSATYFRIIATCVASDTSASALVAVKPFYECYCFDDLNPIGCGNGDILDVQIQTSTLNNNSTCNFNLPQGAYSLFAASGSSTANLQQGTAYNIAVNCNNNTVPLSTSVWIDYNRNGIFENTEWLQIFANGFTGNIGFTIPVNAGVGLTGMRIRSRYATDSNGPDDACERFTSGETEDYLITISSANPCTDPPLAGNISGTLSACTGTSANLTLTGFTPGTTLQWQSSPDGTAWTNIAGANNNTLTTSALNTQTHFRVEVSCATVVYANAVIVDVVQCYNMTNGTIVTCIGNFYDDGGGVSDYSNNQNLVYTITPLTGNLLQVNFNTFSLESNFDFLKIYDGNNTSATQIGPQNGYTGNSSPGIITSSAPDGSLTFQFTSNNTNTATGWFATLNCVASACSGTPFSGNIIQPNINCVGESTSLTLSGSSAGAGITYQWQESDDDGINDPFSNIIVATNQTYNTPALLVQKWYRVLVTCSNSGLTSTTSSYQVQLKPLPQIIITSNAPTCEGLSVNFFSVNNAPGQFAGNTFSWTGAAGFNANISNPFFTNASAINVGYYYLTITNQFLCAATDSVYVDVLPNPVLTEITHTDVSCNAGTDGLTDIDAVTGSAPFLFTDGNQFNSDGIFAILSAGLHTIYVDDANGCSASIDVTILEPAPTTFANAGPDQSVCEYDATLFGNTPFVGEGTWSFVSGGGTINNPNDPLSTVTNLQQGINILRWTIKYNSCPDSSFDDVEINAGDIPTAVISGDRDICTGGSAQIKIEFTGQAPWNYSYTDGNSVFGPFSTSNPITFVTVSPSISTSYALVSVVFDNCSGETSGIASITVSTSPPAGQTSALNGLPTYGCVGASTIISCNPVSRATAYEWDAPLGSYFDGNLSNTSPYTSSGTSTQITFGQPNGSGYSVCVKPVNGCGSALQRCSWIRGLTSVPTSITGATVVCENMTSSYTTALVGGATGYTWNGTNGITITNGNGTPNITATFAPGFTQGTVCVSSNTPCYVSPPKCLTIKNSVAQLPVINGPNGICPNPTPYFYNITPVQGLASYVWNLPIATSGASTSNSIGITYSNNFSSGNICAKGVSICGVPTAQRCTTIVTGVAPTPSAIAGSTTALCGQTVVYNSTPVQGASSYTWTVPAGSTLNQGQGTSAIEVSFNSSSFTVDQICVVVNSGCPSPSAPRCIGVKGPPAKPGAITANPTAICPFQEGVQFSIPAAQGNYLLNWLTPNDASIISGQGTNSINVDFGSMAGNVIVTASNPCGNASSTYYVDLNCRVEGSSEHIIQQNNVELIELAPNPTKGKVYVSFYYQMKESVKITVIDVLGKTMLDKLIKDLESKSLEIDLTNNKPGIYFLRIETNEGTEEKKIVLTD